MGILNESEIGRNNLDKSSSPYLLQHVNNPIWWQEWSDELIKLAVKIKKPLFVSVGYATCHWCHVMASEAFSDIETANYLNNHFICIKVDREQRADIDQFMMDYITKQNGRGGWPLNVFLTPELHPFYALTYAPAKSVDTNHSFLSVARQVFEYFEKNGDNIPPFISIEDKHPPSNEASIIRTLSEYYDSGNGGFGDSQKFPSHSTLLYLLYQLSIDNTPSIKTICIKTLDNMRLRGLNDHLQGGIFRYCVDPEWTIPHFEKMLYDQAMVLWCYSLAYKVIGKDGYRIMAENVLRCLNESFEENGFYITAHDADTAHEEGATYLWSYEQLKDALDDEEFKRFSNSYFIEKTGNFEGLIHLIRKNETPLVGIESKLLAIRKKREQPLRDDKILCGINALVALSMIQTSRLLNKPELENKAALLVKNLLAKFWDGTKLSHSYYKGFLQQQGFLSDAAAMLIAITMLYENDREWEVLMNVFANYVESFKEGEKWIESKADDFHTVYASSFDHPIPSGVSLAEMGLSRFALITGKEIPAMLYRQPFQSDFYNLTVMLSNGLFHTYTTKRFIPWSLLPVNSLQLRGEHESDCYRGACRPFDSHHIS